VDGPDGLSGPYQESITVTFRKIKTSPLALAALSLLSAQIAQARSDDRVSPAALPLPLPGTAPMPPDRLRADNPWNLPMTGPWRFRLTHGRVLDGGKFATAEAFTSLAASSHEAANPPQDAFDGKPETRWCASSGSFPQFLQADLGAARHVTGVTLTWERPNEHYRCIIEGGPDGAQWHPLADGTAAPGLGSGPVTLAPADVRFVRIRVLSNDGSSWASLREFAIHLLDNGAETVWRPQPDPSPSEHADEFVQPTFDDRAWDTQTVPFNWEMKGYSLPTYNSVDDTVGLFRRWVTVPKSWAGRRVFWRFDGALDGAEVYVNGHRAGYHESGYTAFDVDLTGLVRPGERNLFAVRVSKTTPSVDAETGDFQCMGGIYRDTSLIAVPLTHIGDITVRTPLATNDRDATLQADVQVAGDPGAAVDLTGTLVGADGRATPVGLTGRATIGADGTAIVSLSAPVTAPRLWSAESPSLYYLVLALNQGGKTVERTEQRFGFRQVEIKDNVVLWNGRPIKCTGVCRHDFWPTKGFALTDVEWNKDLTLMKAANVNAIRTSHYNHAARFLELCEERGFYILDEVPFCWINEKNNDPSFAPALLLRAADTLGRDKNRPCVLAWSLGNENGVGRNSQTVIDYVKAQDPTRPAFISQGGYWGPKGQSFQDMHYPTPADIDNYLAKDATKLPAQFSEQPHTFYAKAAQDYDPGISDLWSEALIGIWDKVWASPTIEGSFVWEWQNQGIADPNPDKTTDFYYGPDHLRQENNKGVVDAYRNPKPEWWAVRMVYSPIGIAARTVSPVSGSCGVALVNRYSFTDLNTLSCRWTALKGDTPLKTGTTHFACPPSGGIQANFPAPNGMTALRLEFDHADGTSVTSARLAVAGTPPPAPPSAMAVSDALTVQDSADALTVAGISQQAVFDKTSGLLRSWRVKGRDVLTGGPMLNLGPVREKGPKGYYASPQPPSLRDVTIVAQPQPDRSVRVVVTGSVHGDAVSQSPGTLTCTYDLYPDAEVVVHWTLDWTAAPTKLLEAGMTMTLPPADRRMQWWRDSYFTDYPPGHIGEPTGTCGPGDVSFRASKRGLHWLTLTDTTGTGLTLLAADAPLIGRAGAGADGGLTLFASREASLPKDLSTEWVAAHDINAVPGKPLSGNFRLRATVGAH
jgi:beta-galactosidase